MQRIYKITAIGIAVTAAIAYASARAMAAGEKNDPVIVGTETTKLKSFGAESIKNATISDEGESYTGEYYLSADGRVTHPEWFEGDKLIKADGVYYLVKAKAAPEYYYSGNAAFADNIIIGDETAERKNEFSSVRTSEPRTRTVDGSEYSYRTISPCGSMLLNLKCSPKETNYLTVQLWGGDTGDTILWVTDPISGNMNFTDTAQPHRNSLADRRDWVELNTASQSPQYDGGFIYATYLIPKIYTEGKESVSLRLYSTGGSAAYANVTVKEQTEESRGIYGVYMSQSADFKPWKYGISDGAYSGNIDDLYSISDEIAMERQYEELEKLIKRAVAMLKEWQIYGDTAPQDMVGMITRSTDWQTKSSEDDDWRDVYYNSDFMLRQNMTPLNLLEAAAYAYNNSDKLGIDETERAELLDRIIKSIDFLCRAQGANGGFYSADGWIGGPERKAAVGNNLTGFGLRSVGKSVLEVWNDIDSVTRSEYIDSDGDGIADTARITAWEKMFSAARDYLITIEGGYGHAPNQDAANSIAALAFDAVLKRNGSSKALIKGAVGTVLDINFGLSKNPVTSSYWVSSKGTILENFGSVQGGYSGDYGTNAITELSSLAKLAKSEYGFEYKRYLNSVYSAVDNYYFTGKKLSDGEFVPQLYSEGIISNRNGYYPGTERYPIDIYGAVELKNDTALKITEKFLTQQNLTDYDSFYPENVHFEENLIGFIDLYDRFDDVLEQCKSRRIAEYEFRGDRVEETPYVWADETARNVVIKDGGKRIYMVLNWRNPAYTTSLYNTSYSKDKQSIMRNNLCRVHAVNDYYDSYGYADMYTEGYETWTDIKNTDGCMKALMVTKYDCYTVIMNSSGETKSWSDFDDTAWLDRSVSYKDLASGKIYSFNGTQWQSDGALKIQPSETMVLKAITLESSEPIIKNGIASVWIENNTDKGEGISVYSADYGEDGALKSVAAKQCTAKSGITEIKLKANENSRIFIWNGEMKPITLK